MALSVNLAQINSAAKGNSDLRETLTGMHLALQSLYAQTGTTPLAKIDAVAAPFTAPPAPSQFAVTGSKWQFHGLHHHTAERFRGHGAAQCNQRAYLSGAVELTGSQLCLRSNDLPRQHQHQLCLAQSWRDSVLAAAIEL